MKFLRRSCSPDRIWYGIAAVFLLAAMLLGLSFGSVRIPIWELFDQSNAAILWYLRLPRVLACVFAGAALSVSGMLIQSVLANRLASPSLIGINAGAGLAVTVCTALGLYGGWQLSLFAFLGAFGAASVISIGAKKFGASRGTVILAGVALNSLLGAVSDTIVTLDPDVGVLSNDFQIGDFSAVTYDKLLPTAVVITAVILLLFTLQNELQLMTLGEENATGLGLNAKAMRTVFLLLAALLAGSAVCLAGLLSFVGLLIPHAVRKLCKANSMLLSALFGGGFVTLCDLIARTAFAPYEIPVGIIMAFLGAPFFLYLLIQGKGGKRA